MKYIKLFENNSEISCFIKDYSSNQYSTLLSDIKVLDDNLIPYEIFTYKFRDKIFFKVFINKKFIPNESQLDTILKLKIMVLDFEYEFTWEWKKISYDDLLRLTKKLKYNLL